MDATLPSHISTILETAYRYGYKTDSFMLLTYLENNAIFYVSYVRPTPDELKDLPYSTVWVCADPDSNAFEIAFRRHAFFPTRWERILDANALVVNNDPIYTKYVVAPAGTEREEQFHAPLLPRVPELDTPFKPEEVVPLSYVLQLIGEGGGGTDPNLVRRVEVLETEVLKLQSEIANIDTTYNHIQDYVSTTWKVEHGLGEHPSVIQVMTDRGAPMFPQDIVYDETKPNQFIVVFSSPEKGRVAAIR